MSSRDRSSARRLTARALRAVLSREGLIGTGREIAWCATHLVSYPLGVLQERTAGGGRESADRFTLGDLPPAQRGLLLGDVVAAGTPIVLLHGFADNRSIFNLLRRALRRRGFGQLRTLNYSPFTDDVDTAARQLGALVERTCESTGYDRVHVVGHSLGGLVARYYVQHLGGDARVHTLVTLGSPHTGTYAAHLMPTELGRQLRPGSELFRRFAEPAPGCRTRIVAFWSDLDQLVVPKQAARIEHPDLSTRNVFVRGVGHLSLPIDRRVVHQISTLLSHLDEDGGTLAEGVTALPDSAAATAPSSCDSAASARPAHAEPSMTL